MTEKKMKGTKRRMLALVLALAMVVCCMPLYSGSVTAQAAETFAWASWEDLYNAMAAKEEEDGLDHRSIDLKSLATWADSYAGYDTDGWELLVEIMESLDIADAETDYEKVYAIANWIGENISYGGSNNPYRVLTDGEGLCGGYAATFCIMCEYVGVSAVEVACNQTEHAWNAVEVDGNWYWADLTNFTSVEEQLSLSWGGVTFLYGNDSMMVQEYWKVLENAVLVGSPVNDLISDYGYYYYNSSCNGDHEWTIQGHGDAGANYACEAGGITYKCSKCGCEHCVMIESDTPHTWETVTVDPTCTTAGYTYEVCSVCGIYHLLDGSYYDYKNYTEDALGHNDDVFETKQEATCTASGYGYTYCSRCGKLTGTVTIPATGHSWSGWVVTSEATAVTAGEKTRTCSVCGETQTQTISPTGADLSDAVLTLEYDTCEYDNTLHYPEVTVVIDGETVKNTTTSAATSGNTYTVTGDMYTVSYPAATRNKIGDVTVTVSGGTSGLLTGEETLSFTIEKADTTVTASINTDSIEAGSTAQITASAAVNTTGTSRTVYYESSDTSVATVNSSGLVTGVSSGVAVITVYTAYNATYYNQGYAYITVTVTEADKTDISGAAVTLGASSYTYDGTAKEPSVTVTYNGTTLVSGTDYMVSYADNVNAGTATVTVAGCGNYTGYVTKTFTIAQADISSATVTLDTSAYTYDGTAKTPSVTVTLNSVELVSGTDYLVTYSDNTNAGTGTVTVTGTGNYTGTASKTFTIAKAPQVLTLSAGSTSVTVGNTLALAAAVSTGNEITFTSSDTSVATVSSSGVVTGVSAGTATITASVAGTANYSAASASITITVAKVVMDISGATVKPDTTSYTYDGTAKTPSVTVTLDGVTLVSGADYLVSYSDNINAGTATVTVTGTGSYTGTATAAFTIAKASQVITLSASVTTITEGNTLALTASVSTGNTITYASSNTSVATVSSSGVVTGISAGTVTITASVAGTDNYSAASASVTLTVKAASSAATDISGATVTLGTSSYTYDGTAKEPSVTVKLGSTTLTKDTDYTVSYSSNVNAGTAAVTITGTGSYTGTATATFTIAKAPQVVTLSASSTTLTAGSTLSLTGSVSTGNTITYTSSDTSVATVSSSGVVTGVSAGTVTITASVATTANYSAGSASVTVTVNPAAASITAISNTTSGIKLTWDEAAGASGYKVYRKTSATSYTLVKTITSASTLSYTDTAVKDNSGTTYTYKVVPYSGSYTGTNGNTKTIIRLSSATISSVANVTSGITVKWGKITGANGYYVYRKVSGGSYSLVKTVTSGSTVSYTDTAVKSNSGKTYTYYVIPYYKNSSGTVTKGSYTNTKTIIRLSSAKVSSLTNVSSGITVKWGKITGANGYYVYRKVSGGSYSLVKTITSGNTVSYTDTAVKSKNGTTYIYYVIPYYKNSSGTVTKGSYANTKTTARLTAVSISSLTNSSSKKMTVKWAKNSKATGYQIQYSTGSTFASGNKTVTVSGASTVSKVISSLTKGKTYYVRVRVYKTVSGTKYYSAWSSKKSAKISK